MPLTAGTRLGSYEVVSSLGAGGMGEVYRARDTKLGRSVALKVLPDAVAADPERIARFEREAKVLASLNHPHIATLFGMEEADGRHFLLMELVEGETLAERLARGPLAVDEALKVVLQIAEALEAAHESSVVHRDLKPANVKINPDGTVKVLDFGLAKALEKSAEAGSHDHQRVRVPGLSHSPTLSAMATQAGVILGTAAYMSPEQAKGQQADSRSDVFSFGVVLYEMLTGRKPFQGDTELDMMAAVLAREADLSALPARLSPRLVDLVRRCLEKNPKRRWQAVGDLRVELETVAAQPHAVSAMGEVGVRRQSRGALVLAAAFGAIAAALITGGAMWSLRSTPSPPPPARFSVTLGEGQQFTNAGRHVVAISPDGTKIVYVANNRLYLRSLGDLEARLIAGTNTWNAVTTPVFSPDGLSIAFYSSADNTLKKIAVSGGAAITLCSANNPFGVSWGDDGIVFGQGPGGILRVSPEGGQPDPIVRLKDGELAHGPQMLADGRVVLFTLATTSGAGAGWDTAQVVAQSIESGERRLVIASGSDARYLPTGHLVYAVSGVLFAVKFDLARLATVGGPVPVVEGVRRAPGTATAAAQVSVSATGSLVYLPGPAVSGGAQLSLAVVDRAGQVVPLKLPPGPYGSPRFSPDGARVAVELDDGKEAAIGIYDLSGASALRRLTLGAVNRAPIWSVDGTRVTFQSDRDGDLGIFWQRADGTGAVERLTKPEPGTSHVPDAWSPDGDTLVFEATKEARRSLWTLTLRDRKVEPFGLVESSEAIDATLSRDGRWVAYDVAESEAGDSRVYVEPFPRTGARYQIVIGRNPIWSPDGKELFYAPGPTELSVVSVSTQPSFGFGNPVSAPRGFGAPGPGARRNYDLSPDGKRIIGVITGGVAPVGALAAPTIHVVLNWFEELKARVP